MNIDELTLSQIKQIKSLIGESNVHVPHPFLGKYVIVRTYSAGVFAGTLKQVYGNKIILENSRRLWKWHTANNGISLSEVGVYGINQSNSRICCIEPLKEVEPVEITPASDIARKSIEGAPDYVA